MPHNFFSILFLNLRICSFLLHWDYFQRNSAKPLNAFGIVECVLAPFSIAYLLDHSHLNPLLRSICLILDSWVMYGVRDILPPLCLYIFVNFGYI